MSKTISRFLILRLLKHLLGPESWCSVFFKCTSNQIFWVLQPLNVTITDKNIIFKTNFIGYLSTGGQKSKNIFLVPTSNCPKNLATLANCPNIIAFFQLKRLPCMKNVVVWYYIDTASDI